MFSVEVSIDGEMDSGLAIQHGILKLVRIGEFAVRLREWGDSMATEEVY